MLPAQNITFFDADKSNICGSARLECRLVMRTLTRKYYYDFCRRLKKFRSARPVSCTCKRGLKSMPLSTTSTAYNQCSSKRYSRLCANRVYYLLLRTAVFRNSFKRRLRPLRHTLITKMSNRHGRTVGYTAASRNFLLRIKKIQDRSQIV